MYPELFVFMGLIASGKSTLAKAWAERKSLAYYNSDVVRKEIAGLQTGSRAKDLFGKGIYSKEYTRKTYDALLSHAAAELKEGRSVVLDASYSKGKEREYVIELADRFRANYYFILCRCDENTTRSRLAKREKDPAAVSDADLNIYQKQKESFQYPDMVDQVIIIDTAADVGKLLELLDCEIFAFSSL